MTKKELVEALNMFDDNDVVICEDESGGWDNIQEVKRSDVIRIIFGGSSPFGDE